MDNEEAPKDSESSIDKGKRKKEKLVAPIYGKAIIPMAYINTREVANAQNLISSSEPPAPKVIMVNGKIRTDVSFLSVVIGASVIPDKRIPRKKSNMKSP